MIKTAKELLNVFYNVRMNYKDIPLNQRLYVLEDIDAADLKDVVGERGKSEEKKEGGEEGDKEKEDSDSGVDMNLLQLLKSSATMGRLDKALIRPGRIDMKVKFGLCTADNIVQMYKH